MQRQKQVIELSEHVRNRIDQHHHQAGRPSSNTSEEMYESSNIEDEEEDQDDTRPPAESFLSEQRAMGAESVSYLQENYERQRQCRECSRRAHLLHVEQQRLQRASRENQKLHEQIRSSIALNRHYADENRRLKAHLDKINTHLYQYQLNFDQLKQKIQTNPKNEDEEQMHVDHFQRLRHEVEMYNRHVAAKDRDDHFSLRWDCFIRMTAPTKRRGNK